MLCYFGVVIIPRVARKKSSSGVYHIILRGINRQTIFRDEEDHKRFLYTLSNFRNTSGYRIYAYCLMGNHLHLLIKEENEKLGITMRRIGASYVYWYNYKYERSGHLFQDRYKSEAVEDDSYLLTVIRYIHQNPVKAGITDDVSSYRWSSYNEYTGKPEIIDRDFVLNMFSEDRETALSEFQSFHKKPSDQECLEIHEFKRLKDHEAIKVIKEVSGFSDIAAISGLSKEERDKHIRKIKAKGLSTRQIARLTGVNRSTILKA